MECPPHTAEVTGFSSALCPEVVVSIRAHFCLTQRQKVMGSQAGSKRNCKAQLHRASRMEHFGNSTGIVLNIAEDGGSLLP